MTNKLKYFIGNWKMFGDLTSLKIIKNINDFSLKHKKNYKAKIVLCIPNTLIYFFNKKIKNRNIYLGSQNCHIKENFGSYTGSVSASMLKNVGSQYVILGHSENRSNGETNIAIKEKIQSSLNQKLNVIFCFGETSAEKKSKKTFLVLKKQLKDSLESKFDINKILFAYEPVWSIGSNKIPTSKELKSTFFFLKKEIKKILKSKKNPRILYGGSVNHENVSLFSTIAEIDGFLIGRASQSSKKFIDIIKNYYKQ